MYEVLENILTQVTQYSILILEVVGVVVIMATAVRCMIAGIKRNHIVPLMLGKGIALALEFMLASEVLRTVVSPDTKDLIAVGVTLLRGAMTVLIHWESKNEESHEARHANSEQEAACAKKKS